MSKYFLYEYDSEKLLANFSYFFFNEYKEGERNIEIISQIISKKTKWNIFYVKGLIDNLNHNGFIRISKTISGDFVTIIDGAGFLNFIKTNKDMDMHQKAKVEFFYRYLPMFTEFFHRIFKNSEFRKSEISITTKFLEMQKDERFRSKAQFCFKILSEYETYNFFDYIKVFCVKGKKRENFILKISNMNRFYKQFLSPEIVSKRSEKSIT